MISIPFFLLLFRYFDFDNILTNTKFYADEGLNLLKFIPT